MKAFSAYSISEYWPIGADISDKWMIYRGSMGDISDHCLLQSREITKEHYHSRHTFHDGPKPVHTRFHPPMWHLVCFKSHTVSGFKRLDLFAKKIPIGNLLRKLRSYGNWPMNGWTTCDTCWFYIAISWAPEIAKLIDIFGDYGLWYW